MPFLLARTKDDIIYEIDTKYLVYSTVLEDMYSSGTDEVVHLKVISSTILEKVLSWAYYHVDKPARFRKGVREWDRAYIRQLDYPTLVEVNQAAAFLLMTDLVALTESALKQWDTGILVFKVLVKLIPECRVSTVTREVFYAM